MVNRRVSTGIEGLDDVLHGGLLDGQVYMIRGQPGAGKTTLATQFLLAGRERGESTLFVTLSESEAELRASSAAHGWDLDGVAFLDIHPGGQDGSPDSQYTIFHPADVELAPVTERIAEAMKQLRPTRIVFDSLTEVRLLSRDPLRYRRQLLALKNYLLSQRVTSLFLGESALRELDVEVASIVQGVIALNLVKGRNGMPRRTVEVEKFRGSSYREGEHPLRIARGGLTVFPRLIAMEHSVEFAREVVPSGIPTLDAMLCGGLDRGTSTMFSGNAGVGKTTLGVSFLAQAVRAGDRGVLYTFDEGPAGVAFRCESVGLRLRDLIDAGRLHIHKVNPLLLYPDQFAGLVREEVEQHGTRLVMLDSLNGYRQIMPDEEYLTGHMHQLTAYLNRMGVTTILVNEVSNLTGDFAASNFGMSYLADTVILLKYYEYRGGLHKAIGILKKRLGDHEKTLRSFQISADGVQVGDPLPHLRSILRGEADLEASSPDGRPRVAEGVGRG